MRIGIFSSTSRIDVAFVSARVLASGTTILLGLFEPVTAGSAVGAITYKVNGGAAKTPTAITVTGAEIRLTVPTIAQGDTVTFSYDKNVGTLESKGLPFAQVTNKNVLNQSIQTRPVLLEAQVVASGLQLILSYDKVVGSATFDYLSGLVLVADAVPIALSNPSIAGSEITYDCAQISENQVCTVSYNALVGTLKSPNGLFVATYSLAPVINNSIFSTGVAMYDGSFTFNGSLTYAGA